MRLPSNGMVAEIIEHAAMLCCGLSGRHSFSM
jgi:hypothetical protein